MLNNQPVACLYFVAFVITGSFSMMVFVSLLIDRFNTYRRLFDDSAFLTEPQRQWIRYHKILVKVATPPEPLGGNAHPGRSTTPHGAAGGKGRGGARTTRAPKVVSPAYREVHSCTSCVLLWTAQCPLGARASHRRWTRTNAGKDSLRDLGVEATDEPIGNKTNARDAAVRSGAGVQEEVRKLRRGGGA